MTAHKATSLWDFAAALARGIDRNENTAAMAVLEAHSFNEQAMCQECDGNDRHRPWPCATVRVIATCYGIEAP